MKKEPLPAHKYSRSRINRRKEERSFLSAKSSSSISPTAKEKRARWKKYKKKRERRTISLAHHVLIRSKNRAQDKCIPKNGRMPWRKAGSMRTLLPGDTKKEDEKDPKKVIILILFYRALSNSEARCDPAWPVEARASVCLRIATFWCVNPGNVVECSRTCVVRRKKKRVFFFCEMIFVRACVFYGRVESVLEFFVVGRLNVLIKSHRETIVCPVQGFHPTKTNACPSPK